MSRMDEKDRLAKIVLAELSKRPLRRRDLHNKTLSHGATAATFTSILNYLKRKGFIEKVSGNHLNPYRITEKGRLYWKVI